MTEKLQILIVDDDEMTTQSLVDIMTLKGFQAIAAGSGEEGLEVAHQRKIDVLLTDVKMPDMNGVELYIQLKETQPNIMALLMTAYAADEIINKGVEEGVSFVFTKPLDIELLIDVFIACQGS